ncbi:MAG: hypothetical protein Q8M29_14645 [Bacteroidota bacterium]|nr:hypothetical protein [Bacteroidota bacterium]
MKFFTFSLFILFSSFLFGQVQYDTLVLVNGSKKAVIIKEIGDKTIKYKVPTDSTGPTYVVQTKLIEKFILKNGCIDLKEVGYNNCVKDPTYGVILNPDFKRVIISMDLAQLSIIQHIQANVEYIPKNRKFGFEAYYNKGLTDRKYVATYERKEATINKVEYGDGYYKYQYVGFNIKIYPHAHKKLTYFMAFGTEQGKAGAYLTITKFNSNPNWWNNTPIATTTKTRVETYYANYHFNNGCVLRIKKYFILQGNIALGINQFTRYKEDPKDKNQFDLSAKLGLGLMMGVAF